ncbi:MAG TPA: hypothetical protein VG866_00215 [Candidatus Paceibacterota bacterium]|jgi:hypothetical protein|nr:hypothetical protein [Candidatus Paceibacterota bacterium]
MPLKPQQEVEPAITDKLEIAAWIINQIEDAEAEMKRVEENAARYRKLLEMTADPHWQQEDFRRVTAEAGKLKRSIRKFEEALAKLGDPCLQCQATGRGIGDLPCWVCKGLRVVVKTVETSGASTAPTASPVRP